MVLIITSVAIAYMLAEGAMNAGVFAHGGSLTKWPYNIHNWLLLPRGVVLVLVAMLIMSHVRGWGVVGLVFGITLTFPFFHDGMYYATRSFLDYKDYSWWSKSTTTTAMISLDAPMRVFMLLLGIALYLSIYLNETGIIFKL